MLFRSLTLTGAEIREMARRSGAREVTFKSEFPLGCIVRLNPDIYGSRHLRLRPQVTPDTLFQVVNYADDGVLYIRSVDPAVGCVENISTEFLMQVGFYDAMNSDVNGFLKPPQPDQNGVVTSNPDVFALLPTEDWKDLAQETRTRIRLMQAGPQVLKLDLKEGVGEDLKEGVGAEGSRTADFEPLKTVPQTKPPVVLKKRDIFKSFRPKDKQIQRLK